MKTKTKSSQHPVSSEPLSFEESLRRLEEIVGTIESGKVNLDEVMKMYEEGVRLSKTCLDQLSQAETKLKRLGKDMEGNLALVDDVRTE